MCLECERLKREEEAAVTMYVEALKLLDGFRPTSMAPKEAVEWETRNNAVDESLRRRTEAFQTRQAHQSACPTYQTQRSDSR